MWSQNWSVFTVIKNPPTQPKASKQTNKIKTPTNQTKPNQKAMKQCVGSRQIFWLEAITFKNITKTALQTIGNCYDFIL